MIFLISGNLNEESIHSGFEIESVFLTRKLHYAKMK